MQKKKKKKKRKEHIITSNSHSGLSVKNFLINHRIQRIHFRILFPLMLPFYDATCILQVSCKRNTAKEYILILFYWSAKNKMHV